MANQGPGRPCNKEAGQSCDGGRQESPPTLLALLADAGGGKRSVSALGRGGQWTGHAELRGPLTTAYWGDMSYLQTDALCEPQTTSDHNPSRTYDLI